MRENAEDVTSNILYGTLVEHSKQVEEAVPKLSRGDSDSTLISNQATPIPATPSDPLVRLFGALLTLSRMFYELLLQEYVLYVTLAWERKC